MSNTEPQPVTVSITRHIDPAHHDEMLAWVRAGSELASRAGGFLGSGWVRPAPGSDQWHMLYRFADEQSLRDWEASSQRAWWLGAAQGIVEDDRVERFTGIEGWFDPPQSYDVEDLRPQPSPPPRWRQAVVIFMVFFPLSVAVNWLGSHTVGGLPLVLRVLLTVSVMTPTMTYLALPWMTRRMEWFLQGRPAPWSRAGRRAAQRGGDQATHPG